MTNNDNHETETATEAKVEVKANGRGKHPGIYLRGSIYWIQYSVRGERMRESSESADLADAKRLLKKRNGDVQAGKPVGRQVEKTTLKDLRAILLDEYAANGRRSTERVADALDHVASYFGDDCKATAIGSDRLTAYVRERLDEGAANATINRELSAVKRAFKLALKAGRVAAIPSITMLAENNAREGFIEQGQLLALREALAADLRDPITFLWLTGWRVCEMRSLTWASVHNDAIRLARANSKNRHGRELPLVGELAEVIARARADRRLDCPFVFQRDGQPILSFRKSWKAACKAAGLGAIHVHDLRRSAARNLIRAGISENVAMRFTGHKTASIFRRYDIVTRDDLAEAAQRLEAHLSSQPAAPSNVVAIRTAR
jgi:integrase